MTIRNRLANVLYMNTRSMNVITYTNKTVYEIPLFYHESMAYKYPQILQTFKRPHVEISEHQIKVILEYNDKDESGTLGESKSPDNSLR